MVSGAECVLTPNENGTAYNVSSNCAEGWEVANYIMGDDGQPIGITGPGGESFIIYFDQQYEE